MSADPTITDKAVAASAIETRFPGGRCLCTTQDPCPCSGQFVRYCPCYRDEAARLDATASEVVEPTTPGPIPGIDPAANARLDAIEVDLRGGYIRSGEHIAEDPEEYRDEQFVNVADLPSIIHAWALAAVPHLTDRPAPDDRPVCPCVTDDSFVHPGEQATDQPATHVLTADGWTTIKKSVGYGDPARDWSDVERAVNAALSLLTARQPADRDTETAALRDRKTHPWPHDTIADDFRRAVCGQEYGGPDTRTVGLAAPETSRVAEYEVADVVRWQVTYHSGSPWKPGDDTGTEMSLHAVLRLRTGQWASVEAWNDYTGWGCQDGSVVRIGDTEDGVVWHGLSDEGRRALGYDAASLGGEQGG